MTMLTLLVSKLRRYAKLRNQLLYLARWPERRRRQSSVAFVSAGSIATWPSLLLHLNIDVSCRLYRFWKKDDDGIYLITLNHATHTGWPATTAYGTAPTKVLTLQAL
jgi:hypothetical protein